ncbi:MAG TPA: PhaM family polyhydroxyalkanoate granule multifunctional regulatory protein [Ramlibacter sp.]|nr:PhaM family polyhydroxyalkanoate granule multifunctional regulatory protein [Ramlibacter sp.]
MSDTQNFGFGKFVPGFDFLQNLAKGATQSIPQLPNLSNWIAPTLSVEELDKRIQELKAVHFWLDQNGKALHATIQALEVQKMTLATLQGMNFSMGELANALKLKTPQVAEAPAAAAQQEPESAAEPVEPAPRPAREKANGQANQKGDGAQAGAGRGPVDPLQWWGALTQQFQQIATQALQDAARNTAMDTARNMAAGMAKDAVKGASDMVKAATPGGRGGTGAKKPAPARKSPRKAAARKKTGT